MVIWSEIDRWPGCYFVHCIVIKFTKAAVALHNYLRTEESSVYCPSGYVDEEDGCGNIVPGAWRRDGGRLNTGLSPFGSGIAGNRLFL